MAHSIPICMGLWKVCGILSTILEFLVSFWYVVGLLQQVIKIIEKYKNKTNDNF